MSNAFVIGGRTLSGKYKRVYSAGEVRAEESEIEAIYGAGEVEISQSSVKKVRVAGSLKANKSKILNVNAVGDIALTGVTQVEYMVIRGELSAECLECKHLVIDDKADRRSYANNRQQIDAKIDGFIKVGVLENYAELDMSFEYEIKNLVNCGVLLATEVVECEALYSFGLIESKEINAEDIYIKPSTHSKVNQIVGSNIQLTKDFQLDQFLKSIPKKYFKDYYNRLKNTEVSIMSLQFIEGDKIHIDYVNADLVSGIDVTIGDLCIIDRVEYTGSIKVSPKAIVNEVVKL